MDYKSKHDKKNAEETVKTTQEEPAKTPDDSDSKLDEALKEKNAKKLDKLMKKKSKREKRSDRSVLSYEDLPLDEREEKKKAFTVKLNKKRVTVAVIIVLALFLIVFLFANSDRLSIHNITNFIQYGVFNKDSDERFPLNIQGENITTGNFQRIGQDLCYASDTKLQMLNNYGRTMLTSQHSYSTPVMITSDKYTLLYNLGGTGFQIHSGDESIYSGNAEHNIIAGDMIDNGTYAFVTQCDGYLSKLYVYDNENKKIFAYSFADYYITALSLCPNGKRAALAGLSALNGDEISSVYVLDFTKDKPEYFEEFEENIIYDMQYLNDNCVSAVGSTAVRVVNTRSGSVEITEYEGRTLTAYTVNRDTDTLTVSLSRSGDGRNCDICSFKANGTKTNEFSTEHRVIDISTYKGRVALLTTDSVYLYNKDGGLISEKDAGVAPKAVVLYTSSDAYILDTSEIRSISL